MEWEHSLVAVEPGETITTGFGEAAGVFVLHAEVPAQRQIMDRAALEALQTRMSFEVHSAESGRALALLEGPLASRSEYFRSGRHGVGLCAFEASWGGPFRVTFLLEKPRPSPRMRFILGPHAQQPAAKATLGFAAGIISGVVLAAIPLAMGYRFAARYGLIDLD